MVFFGVAGCDTGTNPFSEWDGEDWLSNSRFDSGNWSVEQVAMTGSSWEELESVNATYITYETVSTSAAQSTNGLPTGASAASIRRLEIPNLMPNGDFEAGTTGWTNNGADTLTVTSGTDAINGETLRYAIGLNLDATVEFQLDAATNGLKDAFVGNDYSVWADVKFNTDSLWSYYDGGTNEFSTFFVTDPSPGATDPAFEFAEQGSLNEIAKDDTASDHYFAFGTHLPEQGRPQDIYVDNLRIARDDLRSYLTLALSQSQNDSDKPELISGTYTFSIFVRFDPTHTNEGTTTGDNVSNRFLPEAVTLEMRVADANGTHTLLRNSHSAAGDWSAWTEISVQGFVQFNAAGVDTDTERLELAVSPTDFAGTNGQAPGSILIAAPSLTYKP
jgi:hypothetical protein